jgi:putative SOS response-associated peptidase YedK
MCGRFLFTSPPEAVGRAFEIAVTDNFPPRYNVAPTQPIAIIRRTERGQREFALARWGFIPSWAKSDFLEKTGGKPLINARGETVAEKPTFRSAFRRRRCLVPADGFYEWKTEGGARQPYLIRPSEGGVFGFAGVWETALDPDGGEIDTAAIITTEAGPDLSTLHSREPVVITRDDYGRWLSADERDAEILKSLLAHAPEGFWTHHAVSKAVNNATHEGEALARVIGNTTPDHDGADRQ